MFQGRMRQCEVVKRRRSDRHVHGLRDRARARDEEASLAEALDLHE